MILFLSERYTKRIVSLRKKPPASLRLTRHDYKFWVPLTFRYLQDIDRRMYIDTSAAKSRITKLRDDSGRFPKSDEIYNKLLREIKSNKIILTKSRRRAEALAHYLAILNKDKPRVLLVEMNPVMMSAVRRNPRLRGYYLFEGQADPEILYGFQPDEIDPSELESIILGEKIEEEDQEESQDDQKSNPTEEEKSKVVIPHSVEFEVENVDEAEFEKLSSKLAKDLYPKFNYDPDLGIGDNEKITEEFVDSISKELETNEELKKINNAFLPTELYDPVEYTRKVLSIWKNTSADSNQYVITLQMAAQKLLNLPDDCLAHRSYYIDRQVRGTSLEALIEPNMELLRIMYNRTQEELKKAGIDYLYLFRAMAWSDRDDIPEELDDLPWDGETIVERLMMSQPLSSFTASPHVLTEFLVTDAYNVVLMAKIPREAIMAFFGTGLGCATEEEFVIRGGIHKFRVLSWYEDESNPSYIEERMVDLLMKG